RQRGIVERIVDVLPHGLSHSPISPALLPIFLPFATAGWDFGLPQRPRRSGHPPSLSAFEAIPIAAANRASSCKRPGIPHLTPTLSPPNGPWRAEREWRGTRPPPSALQGEREGPTPKAWEGEVGVKPGHDE